MRGGGCDSIAWWYSVNRGFIRGALWNQHQHNQSLQDRGIQRIALKIIYAELRPGTRLSAIGLEKETGIGRTPIREVACAPA